MLKKISPKIIIHIIRNLKIYQITCSLYMFATFLLLELMLIVVDLAYRLSDNATAQIFKRLRYVLHV
jgi:hypothetical protein